MLIVVRYRHLVLFPDGAEAGQLRGDVLADLHGGRDQDGAEPGAIVNEQLRPRVTLAAVTRGAQGSVVLTQGERLTVASEPVEKVVDTTGAGDQYAAGFMFGLARGRPLQQCGKLGSLAAAEVISHYGPRPQVSLKELAASKGY